MKPLKLNSMKLNKSVFNKLNEFANTHAHQLAPNQSVIKSDIGVLFYSYGSLIAIYTKLDYSSNGFELMLNNGVYSRNNKALWKCSKTTLKWLKEYINIYTYINGFNIERLTQKQIETKIKNKEIKTFTINYNKIKVAE